MANDQENRTAPDFENYLHLGIRTLSKAMKNQHLFLVLSCESLLLIRGLSKGKLDWRVCL